MKISERWLREWVAPRVTTNELVDQLSMAGLEVEGTEPVAPAFSGVVVAEIVDVSPHPDADKLRVCRVRSGGDESVVVCGAPNVRAGMKAAYARPGAVLPDGTRIGETKLRGVLSAGMLCGADELGLGDDASGLLELSAHLETGADLRVALDLDDTVIEIDLTPNRGDCLGIRGLAREVAVLNDCALSEPVIEPVAAAIPDTFPVTVSHADGCPRYLGRVIRGVDVGRGTPPWLAEKLRRCGLRPIDPVVDVTNFVLLELGQPMHAFDLARLEGGIDVRLARPGETLVLLDGSDVPLRPDTLLITDAAGPVAMAGIMGGARSGIAADGDKPTRDIFLECAYFSPEAIAGRARTYGLHTDASHRYERGVDFELQAMAMERATRLLIDIVGGEPGPVTEWVEPACLPVRAAVTLREARVRSLLGMSIPTAPIEAMLGRLGLPIVSTGDSDTGRVWQVQAPSWRFDIEREADLIEEVARIYGYDNIEVSLPVSPMHLAPTDDCVAGASAYRQRLVAAGYQEVINYSFVEPRLNALVDPDNTPLKLANPISADLAVMRTSLWPGLLKAWITNRNRQATRARLCEIGHVFGRDAEGTISEQTWIAGLLAGPRDAEGWAQDATEVDFYDARGTVEEILDLTRDASSFRFIAGAHPGLHPGQAATVVRQTAEGEHIAGWVGRIHPKLAAELDLARPVYLFALALDVIAARAVPVHRGVSRFPSVRRDIAIEIDAAVPASTVLERTREVAGEWLADLRLFDVYAGERLGAGRRSLALAVVLQHPERTLEETEVTARIDQIVAALENAFDAVRR